MAATQQGGCHARCRFHLNGSRRHRESGHRGGAVHSGTHGVPIAQFVTCTYLMMMHRMPELLQFKPSRTWPNRVALAGSTLRSQTVGIIGYGSIGRECARQLAALGMRVVCLKRDPATRRDDGYNAWPGTGDPEGTLPSAWFGPDQLNAMLPECDLVVVAVKGSGAKAGSLASDARARCISPVRRPRVPAVRR